MAEVNRNERKHLMYNDQIYKLAKLNAYELDKILELIIKHCNRKKKVNPESLNLGDITQAIRICDCCGLSIQENLYDYCGHDCCNNVICLDCSKLGFKECLIHTGAELLHHYIDFCDHTQSLLLLTHYPELVSIPFDKTFPLEFAVMVHNHDPQKDLTTIKYLLKNGARSNKTVCTEALSSASYGKNEELLHLLLSPESECNIIDDYDYLPFSEACHCGSLLYIKRFVALDGEKNNFNGVRTNRSKYESQTCISSAMWKYIDRKDPGTLEKLPGDMSNEALILKEILPHFTDDEIKEAFASEMKEYERILVVRKRPFKDI